MTANSAKNIFSNQAGNKYCQETYPGDRAFSEPETRAVRDFLYGIGSKLKIFITLHAYGQMWMVPYAHGKDTRARDFQKLV